MTHSMSPDFNCLRFVRSLRLYDSGKDEDRIYKASESIFNSHLFLNSAPFSSHIQSSLETHVPPLTSLIKLQDPYVGNKLMILLDDCVGLRRSVDRIHLQSIDHNPDHAVQIRGVALPCEKASLLPRVSDRCFISFTSRYPADMKKRASIQ
jgi:hypothetical protein